MALQGTAVPAAPFTESLPAVRARSRLTTRLRTELGATVAEQARVVSESATHYGVDWSIVHDAFVEHVKVPLAAPLPKVKVLGMDETPRGRTVFAQDPDTGRWVLVRDRWHTGLCATRRCLFRLEVKDPMTRPS
jgi:transposase